MPNCRYPYTLVASEGLRVSDSSLNQIDLILPSETWCQSKIKVFPKVLRKGMSVYSLYYLAGGVCEIDFNKMVVN